MDPHHVDADPDAVPDSIYHPDADPDADFDFILCGSGCGSAFLYNADADLTFYPDADPDPDPSFQIKAQTLEKVLK